MALNWLFYALLAPALFSLVNVSDKFLRDKHLGTFTLTIAAGLAWLIFVFLLPFVDFTVPVKLLLAGLLVGLLYFLGGLPYFHALSFEEASRVVPLWALEAPFTLILAFFFLQERLTTNEYIGFTLIVLGSFLVVAKNIKKVFVPNKALMLMILATMTTSIGIVLTKWLLATVPFWSLQILIAVGSGSTALITILIMRKHRHRFLSEIKESWTKIKWIFLSRQIVLIAGILSINAAILLGSPSLTVALGGLAGLYVLVIALVMTKFKPHIMMEASDKKTLLTKTIAISTIIAGMFYITIGK